MKINNTRVKKPVKVFAYIHGTIGALLLGMGIYASIRQLPISILNNIDNSRYSYWLMVNIYFRMDRVLTSMFILSISYTFKQI